MKTITSDDCFGMGKVVFRTNKKLGGGTRLSGPGSFLLCHFIFLSPPGIHFSRKLFFNEYSPLFSIYCFHPYICCIYAYLCVY